MVSKEILDDFNDLFTRHGPGAENAKAHLVMADRLGRIAEAINRHAEAVTKHDFKMLSDSIDDAIKAQQNEDKGTNS